MGSLKSLYVGALPLLAVPAVPASHHWDGAGTVFAVGAVFLIPLVASACVVLSLRAEGQGQGHAGQKVAARTAGRPGMDKQVVPCSVWGQKKKTAG